MFIFTEIYQLVKTFEQPWSLYIYWIHRSDRRDRAYIGLSHTLDPQHSSDCICFDLIYMYIVHIDRIAHLLMATSITGFAPLITKLNGTLLRKRLSI
jgi:hypothetical protein